MLKKITSGIISAVMLASFPLSAGMNAFRATAADTPNYAEALQKSLFFYECQQAGPLPEWNRVEWRSDSTMIDEIKGGWYDAGDHVKFNLPMAYSASMLAWGLYQYPDGIEQCGEMTNYVNNLEFVLDYFVDCDLGTEIVYQVGNGTDDHTWWGPVELYEYGMLDSNRSYEEARATLKASDGCSAVFSEMAAALAAGSCALDGRIDSSKIADYLKHAENIFKIADSSPNDDVYNDSDASSFYRSSHYYDNLFYAANWLYIATGEQSYLDKAKSYIPNLPKMLGEESVLAYGWSHCWDDNTQGAALLYAINTGDQTYVDHIKKHLDRWEQGKIEVNIIEGGLRWLSNWGCLRYASTAGFIAAVACDTVLAGTDIAKYEKFYEEQINYILGDNPNNRSYVVGFGNNPPKYPHHRTSHASWKNSDASPEPSRHTLYGALVGGPNEDGSYEDDRNNFINNEVATDYNAGFTALLCKMIDKYGGKTDPSFPAPEPHDGPEFFVEAMTKGSDANGVSVSFKITNHSAWPARVQDNISFRYYMDLSEVVSAGANPEDVVIRCDRDQTGMYASNGVKPAEISKITKYDGNIYYVEVNLPDGRAALPVSEGMHQCEIMLAFVMPNYGSGWNSENDFSYQELEGGSTTDENGTIKGIVTPYIPVYVNGELYYGYEPDGTYADGMGNTGGEVNPTAPAPETTAAPDDGVVYGDANCDNEVSMADAVLIMQSQANPDKYGLTGSESGHITEEGWNNADVEQRGNGVTGKDALAIQKYLLNLIDSLPESVQ